MQSSIIPFRRAVKFGILRQFCGMRQLMHMLELSNADWPANPVGIKLGMSTKLLDVADIGTVPGINLAQEYHTADGRNRILPARLR